ncbi:MAG: hypothetical protein QOH95_2311 [Gaiellaceae bacterium]|jgi:hypothetical protein|nr:hypothetical protein [Gaiellaceae bacterium]
MLDARRNARHTLPMPSVPRRDDKVRLRAAFGDLSAGTVGHVVGFYANNDVAVSFRTGDVRRIPAGHVSAVAPLHAV